jgi:hypothetical protein
LFTGTDGRITKEVYHIENRSLDGRRKNVTYLLPRSAESAILSLPMTCHGNTVYCSVDAAQTLEYCIGK